jgi:hypothetical protein
MVSLQVGRRTDKQRSAIRDGSNDGDFPRVSPSRARLRDYRIRLTVPVASRTNGPPGAVQ